MKSGGSYFFNRERPGTVEFRTPLAIIDGAAQRIAKRREIALVLVNGRDASANFDMQTFTSLLHGDRITVRRAPYKLCLLHPKGWSYFDTLRKKLHWNEGMTT